MFQLFIDLTGVQTEYDRRLREAEAERLVQQSKPHPSPTAEFLALVVAFAAAFGFGYGGR